VTVEYLERIGTDYKVEKWIVRFEGTLAIAHVYEGDDGWWTQRIDEDTGLWQTFRHEHVVPVYSSHLYNERFVVIAGDDRGANFVKAATVLTEPGDREQWAVIEIAGIAEAIAAMGDDLSRRLGAPTPYVHQRADNAGIVVGADGKARLAPAIAWIAHPKPGTYVGRGNSMQKGVFTYLSPEQCKGLPLTPASNVYNLAATLYSALTLKRPFEGDNDFDLLLAITKNPRPARIDCTPALSELVLRNLAIDPAVRDPDTATFAANLRRIHRVTSADLRARIGARHTPVHPSPQESAAIRGFRCAKQWDQLADTTHDSIRHCGECKTDVVRVRSLEAVIPLLGRRCIAYIPE